MDKTNSNPYPNRPSQRVTTTHQPNLTDIDYRTLRRECRLGSGLGLVSSLEDRTLLREGRLGLGLGLVSSLEDR